MKKIQTCLDRGSRAQKQNKSSSMAARATRQLHPCVSIENRKGGVDFSTWLTINGTQHLATAHTSVLNIYSIYYGYSTGASGGVGGDPDRTSRSSSSSSSRPQYQLQLEHSVVLQGSVISLHTIPSPHKLLEEEEEDDGDINHHQDDMLLLGFTSRCASLVQVNRFNLSTPLRVLSIMEFTNNNAHPTNDNASSSTSITATTTTGMIMEDDLQVEVFTDDSNTTTIAVLTGDELYLSHTLVSSTSSNILLSDAIILPMGEYGVILSFGWITSDTIVLLHRTNIHSMMVTAISDQNVILWSHHVVSDALQLSMDRGSTILVIGANTVSTVHDQGIDHVLPVNGFANIGNAELPPGPHIPLSIALDGSYWVWRDHSNIKNNNNNNNNKKKKNNHRYDDENSNHSSALVILRRGQCFLYAKHRLWDTGRTIHCAEVSTAIYLPATPHPLCFVGSRLSDGLLLTLNFIESVVLPKSLRPSDPVHEITYQFSQQERELYHIVSDDDDDDDDERDEYYDRTGGGGDKNTSKRHAIPILQTITVQDRLVSLAPLSTSSTATVCAVGFGVSGGLAHLQTAGSHGILSQIDLAHVEYLGRIFETTLVLGIKDRGVHILDELGREIPMPSDHILLSDGKVLLAGGEGILVLRNEINYTVVAIDRFGNLQCQWELQHLTSNVVSLTSLLPNGVFGCLEENGTFSLVNVQGMNQLNAPTVSFIPDAPVNMETQTMIDIDDDEEDKELRAFYADPKINAADVFLAPKTLFTMNHDPPVNKRNKAVTTHPESMERDDMDESTLVEFDAEEKMLYAEESVSSRKKDPRFRGREKSNLDDETVYCVICRQNGKMEVYEFLGSGNVVHRWQTHGIALGHDELSDTTVSSSDLPRTQKVSAREICFFKHEHMQSNGMVLSTKSFFAVESSSGDIYLYRVEEKCAVLLKHPLTVVSRQSKEQGRHRAKLVRKGAVAKGTEEDPFKYRKFYPFVKISRQSGLFVATFRPFWVLSDRGYVTLLDHRPLHAAPAGGRQRPIAGFCDMGNGSFVLVHERVGRVGTQRLTLFSDILKPDCVLTGNMAVEKYPLGVTVRKIVALPDDEESNISLYALVVSREALADQSDLNSDGLTDEEREQRKQEKEMIRMKKQVEADLGGFDMENEWVEEIEREDCVQVNTAYGGAPPIPQPAYSLWIVDASNSFRVIDSYQLGEFELGIDLKVMSLTDFSGFDDKDENTEINEETKPEVPFVVVGTGIVARDGEDVAAKGRALLFRVQRTKAHVAELSLVYEKNIFHGPVSTVSCLSAEGNHRLVIGAGADVNVEQWGNERLTQVGFFRATMHISKIQHFKTFLLLSDAYDSVYFLVWRESDKSLTLLAKDYDPIIVYAAGVLARGASLSLCVHDERENLQFFQYAPAEAAARGGNKLVCRADFHLGETTVDLSSTHWCRSPLLVHSATPVSTQAALKQQDPLFGRQDDDHRVAIHFGTADGSLGSIVAVSEPVFWRLMALQSVMANALECDAGLNPRLWRLYRRSNRGCRNSERKKGVIDGNLVFRYANLSFPEREDLASSIGTTVDLIMDNLVDIQCASKIF